MIIKQVSILSVLLFFVGITPLSYASDKDAAITEKTQPQQTQPDKTHHKMHHSMNDARLSLGLSPQMKQHQLSNMRSHLEAVQAITGLIAEAEFDSASKIASSKLGLTEEMKQMCNMFNNKEFTALGLAFHESGDVLAEALKTKDTQESLRALNTTLGHCVQCHATFRQ